jgi:hypothetical protein
MRRKVSAFLAVAVAMLLSVALAVPASADVTPGKPLPVDPRFKYGLSYYYKELFDPANPSGVRPLNVSGTVNPSNVGGSWYLNNVKNARNVATGTTNKPLTGKLFLPGEPLPSGAPSGTVVKPPSVFKPTAPFTGGSLFSGSALFGKLLGTAGFGMGMISKAPSNINDIATSQGVASGCIADQKTCSSGDMQKMFNIANCGQMVANSCSTIGGKDEGGNPIGGDWWKDTAVPFLSDLWAKITGQTDVAPVLSDTQIDVAPRGCMKQVGFTYGGNNNGTVSIGVVQDFGRPAASDTVKRTYYDSQCYGAAAVSPNVSPGQFQTVCLDKTTGLVASNTYSAGGPISGTYWDATTGASKAPLCGSTSTNYVLLSIRFWFPWTQAMYDSSPSDYDAIKYSEWVNPDPNLDTIDSTTVTTTVTCAAPNGNQFTFSETVQKTAAFVAPACPPGYDLAQSSVQATTAAGTKTLDTSAADPAAATKYPLCDTRTGPGCSLWIALDGTPCKVSRTECATWSDVQAQSPSRVQCKWGTYVMPVSDCYGIAEAYKTETGMVLDPKSQTWVAVDANGNPKPVSPQPWNSGNPAPVAGSTPGTTAPPATSAVPLTGSNPSNGCDAPGWSWNPVEWVHNPVVCALKDAFVPKTDIQTRSQALVTSAKQTVPIAWVVAPVPMVGPSGAACPNWTISVDGMTRNVVCDSSFTQAIVAARVPMFGIVASAMVWPLLRGIWYALIPIVRVSPSGSK